MSSDAPRDDPPGPGAGASEEDEDAAAPGMMELIDDGSLLGGPPLPPHLRPPDEEEGGAAAVDGRASTTTATTKKTPLEAPPSDDDLTPLPPHVAHEAIDAGKGMAKGKAAAADPPGPMAVAAPNSTIEEEGQGTTSGGEARADEETPPIAQQQQQQQLPSTQPMPPSNDHDHEASSPLGPRFYPVLEATLVRDESVSHRQVEAEAHSSSQQPPSPPVVHGVLVPHEPPVWRKYKWAILCGAIVIIGAVVAAAAAGASIGSSSNKSQEADQSEGGTLEGGGSAGSLPTPSPVATGPLDNDALPPDALPAGAPAAARPTESPTTDDAPTIAPTTSTAPSFSPTYDSTASPTRCPTSSMQTPSPRPSSPLVPGACVNHTRPLFDDDLPSFAHDKRVCEKNCTPDVAMGHGLGDDDGGGSGAFVARGHRAVHFFATGVDGSWDGTKQPMVEEFASDVWDIASSRSGNIVVVGTPDDNAVHTFTRNPLLGTWIRRADAALAPPVDATPPGTDGTLARFGTSLSVDGDVLVVGAPSVVEDETIAHAPPPAAYIYRWNDTAWNLEARLAPDVENRSWDGGGGAKKKGLLRTTLVAQLYHESPVQIFGNSVVVQGNTVAVADSRYSAEGKNKGAVFVYEYDPDEASWRQIGGPIANVADCTRHFGTSIALTPDDGLVISCPRKDSWSGVAYFYTRTGPGCSYELRQRILASDGRSDDYFGYMDVIAVDGDGMAVGSSRRNNGKVYLFAREGDVWTEVSIVEAPRGVEYFGYEVALSGRHVLVNSHVNAYLYSIGECADGGNVIAPGPTRRPTLKPSVNQIPTRFPTSKPVASAAGQITQSSAVKLDPSEAIVSHQTSRNVAIHGHTAVVGARDNDEERGSAFVFVEGPDGNWLQQAKLVAPDGAAGDWFGYSVDIYGDVIAVGARRDESVHVFVRNGDTWTHQAKLLAPDGAADDRFGISVAIHEDSIVVGAHFDDDNGINSGSIHVFVRNGSNWIHQAKVLAPDGAVDDNFGMSVQIFGDTLAVCAPYDDGPGLDSGSAHVFVRSGEDWEHQAKLLAPDGAAGDLFGWSVGIYEDTIAVGARRDDDSGEESGSAHVFVRNGATWSHGAKLLAPDGAAGDRFGISVAVHGNLIIVGSDKDDDNGEDSGSLHAFVRNDGANWSHEAKLVAPDATARNFGQSVAIYNGTALAGSRTTAYVFPG